mmetsp:Transcript_27747/g.43972  ORF Transcript_27747/g.43972 Transcript_27747/m.43972 type:complete len:240 (-) Transcript_27747:910-1629(-)
MASLHSQKRTAQRSLFCTKLHTASYCLLINCMSSNNFRNTSISGSVTGVSSLHLSTSSFNVINSGNAWISLSTTGRRNIGNFTYFPLSPFASSVNSTQCVFTSLLIHVYNRNSPCSSSAVSSSSSSSSSSINVATLSSCPCCLSSPFGGKSIILMPTPVFLSLYTYSEEPYSKSLSSSSSKSSSPSSSSSSSSSTSLFCSLSNSSSFTTRIQSTHFKHTLVLSVNSISCFSSFTFFFFC